LILPKAEEKKITSVFDKSLDSLYLESYNSQREDRLSSLNQTEIGPNGMKIDRMYFDRFEETVLKNPRIDEIKEQAQEGKWDDLQNFVIHNIFDKPEDYFNVEKLRAALNADRRIPLKEMLEKVLGFIPRFKTKEELLEEEFEKFDSRYMPGENYFASAKAVFRRILKTPNFVIL